MPCRREGDVCSTARTALCWRMVHAGCDISSLVLAATGIFCLQHPSNFPLQASPSAHRIRSASPGAETVHWGQPHHRSILLPGLQGGNLSTMLCFLVHPPQVFAIQHGSTEVLLICVFTTSESSVCPELVIKGPWVCEML